MLIATGHVVARSETLAEVLRLGGEHVRRSRLEPGCIFHSVLQDAEDPLRVVFWEKWTDPEALAAHLALPVVRDFARRLYELSSDRSRVEVFTATELDIFKGSRPA